MITMKWRAHADTIEPVDEEGLVLVQNVQVAGELLSRTSRPDLTTLRASNMTKTHEKKITQQFVDAPSIVAWQPTLLFKQGTARSKMIKRILKKTGPEVVAYFDTTADINDMVTALRVLAPAKMETVERLLFTHKENQMRNVFDRAIRMRRVMSVPVDVFTNTYENKNTLIHLVNSD